jgi:hypothetical protein
MCGIAWTHGPHQVAQKSITVSLPARFGAESTAGADPAGGALANGDGAGSALAAVGETQRT